MLVVLDTNVWLDWLVFNDPHIAPLRKAHTEGRVKIIRAPAGEVELERVLGYKAIKPLVGADQQPAIMEKMRADSILHDGSTRPGTLPVCSDPDDQPFLELARDSGANLLITKDRDLLDLRRAKFAIAGFRIMAPHECASLLREA